MVSHPVYLSERQRPADRRSARHGTGRRRLPDEACRAGGAAVGHQRSGAERLMSLVEDFLLLSQLQTGALAAEKRRGPLQSSAADLVVSQVLEGFGTRASQQGIHLSLRPGAPGSVV